MSALLLAGVGPVPPERPDRLHQPGIRLWGFARALVGAGCRVRLALIDFDGRPVSRVRWADLEPGADAEGAIASVGFQSRAADDESLPRVYAELAAEFGAVAAIGSLDVVNRHLARMDSALPLWMDFPGDPMAERQMLARLRDDDSILADQWRTYAECLLRGDAFSVFSRQQEGAILGQLATLGRLNRHTALVPMVRVIPTWPARSEKGAGDSAIDEAGRARARNRLGIPADVPVLFQLGGFNTWLDEATLFAALERVMERRGEVHFVATGGALKGHDERTAGSFARRIEGSRHAGRYHLTGWIGPSELDALAGAATIAVHADLPCSEGWLGGRHRLLEYIERGIPLVATVGTEIARELADAGMIRHSAQGSAEALAGEILADLEDPPGARARALRAGDFARGRWNIETLARPLLEWAAEPSRAPDLAAWGRGEPRPSLAFGEGEGRLVAIEAELREEVESARARLEAMMSRPLVRAAVRLRDGRAAARRNRSGA